MRSPAFRFAVVNLGCKVNRVEADGFERLLTDAGGAPSPQAEADLIIVNTCTVTGEAEKKTRKAVRHALAVSEEAPVVVTGCAAAINPDFFADLGGRVAVVPKAQMGPYLEALVEDGSLLRTRETGAEAAPRETPADLPAGGRAFALGNGRQDRTPRATQEPEPRPCYERVLGGRTRIGIKVQDGCDNACTYCIVHVARGRATSRPADAVVAEAVALARSGVREIMLTGINLGSYDDDGHDLADLCRRLLDETADLHGPDEEPCRFRVGSIEPMDVSMDFIGLLAEADGRICRHLHLPLQSGISRVLREMGRPYDAEGYRQLVDYLRVMVPEVALTTDVIVGFPGETEEEFDQTLDFVRRCAFSAMHIFPYSRRSGTPAASMPGQVPKAEKEARARRAAAVAEELRAAWLERWVGETLTVLFEEEKEGLWRGHAPNYTEVFAPGEGLHNVIKEVKITGIHRDGLKGSVLE